MLSQCSAAAALLRRNPNGHYLFGLDSGLCGSTRDERRDCISPVPYHVALGYYSVMKLSIVQKKRKKKQKNKKKRRALCRLVFISDIFIHFRFTVRVFPLHLFSLIH